jgi:hypothetical protein
MSDTSTTPTIGANQKAIISKILVPIDGSAASMDVIVLCIEEFL